MFKEIYLQMTLDGEIIPLPDEEYQQLEFENMPSQSKVIEENEFAAHTLEQKGFSISRLPSDIYSNMPYSTSGKLEGEEIVLYTRQHINKLGRDGSITSSEIGSSRIIEAKEIEHILEIQTEKSIESRLGRRPGSKNKRLHMNIEP